MKLKTLSLAALACCMSVPALAVDLASSTASSASSAGSASVGSASDSLRSSGNSSGGAKQMAGGEYRIVELAEVAGHPDRLRLTLAAPQEPVQWELLLPRSVAEREGLAPGAVLRAAQQPYGVSFAVSGRAHPFFLVLDEAWQRELPARPVGADRGA